jgi:putative SOS response-associated peptidase YedK
MRRSEGYGIALGPHNELVAEKTSHDRMPLIVAWRDWQRWLEPGSEEQPPIGVLRPFDADMMKAP